MEQKRRRAIQGLFKVKDLVDPVVEEAYLRRLEESNNLIENFKEQADLKERELSKHTTNEIDQKVRLIARYRTYSKLLFFADKSDVIDESSTSVFVSKLVDENYSNTRELWQYNDRLKNELKDLIGFKQLWDELLDQMPNMISAREEELNQLSQKTNFEANKESLISEVKQQLINKLEESRQFKTALQRSLEKIVWKYLDFNDTANSGQEVRQITSFINKLIHNSSKNIYMHFNDLNAIEKKLIDNLLFNNVIELKNQPNDSSQTTAGQFKLRNFI